MGAADRDLSRVPQEPQTFFHDPDPAVRRLAVSAAAARLGDGEVAGAILRMVLDDDHEAVRAEAAEVVAGLGVEAEGTLLAAAADPSPLVQEAAAFALGEIRSTQAVPMLLERAGGEGDRLVREAAIAALGAIEDPAAIPELIRLSAEAPPQLRRRAVVALSAFEDDMAEAAILAARNDRNPMVREVAEMVVGRTSPGEPLPWPTMRRRDTDP